MYVLEIRDLRARYGRLEVLDGVTLRVARGEWCCLLGPNGVGKTTLLDCAAGRMKPAGGDIRIADHPLATAPAAAKRRLGHACAPDQLPGLLTGRQCLEVYALAKELRRIDGQVLDLAEALRFTPFMDACVDTYSLGTRQKLCVLLGLLGDPDLILLDEAFNALDAHSALELKRYLRERLGENRCGVVLATHSIGNLEHHADTACLLSGGRLAKVWTKEELERLRAGGRDAVEKAIAEASDDG